MDPQTFYGWMTYFKSKPSTETLTDIHLSNIQLMIAKYMDPKTKLNIEDIMLTLNEDEKKKIKNERMMKELDRL
jgi:hypothetical protein